MRRTLLRLQQQAFTSTANSIWATA